MLQQPPAKLGLKTVGDPNIALIEATDSQGLIPPYGKITRHAIHNLASLRAVKRKIQVASERPRWASRHCRARKLSWLEYLSCDRPHIAFRVIPPVGL
jgi:hypothetical protein